MNRLPSSCLSLIVCFRMGRALIFSVVFLLGIGRTRALDVSDVLPIIKTLPAPASIREGFRLSFYSQIANVPKADTYNWIDENGDWQQGRMPSPSGRGVTQVDVVAITPQLAALNVQAWQYYNFTGPLLPIPGGNAALLSYPGGGDWWIHPQALATIQETRQPGLIIIRMPEKVGDRVYNVIRIQRDDERSRNALSYDLETGYLVFKAVMVEGTEAVTLAQTAFAGVREVQVPWAGAPLPGWIPTTSELLYEGSYTVGTLGSAPLVVPLTADLKITSRSPSFIVYDQTVTLGALPGYPPSVEKTTLVTGVNHLSGLFLPLTAFENLEMGQTIDVDNITGATVSVIYVGPLGNGRPGVTSRVAVGTAFSAETSFDRLTGVAVEQHGYSAPSPWYYTETEMTLVNLPVQPPAAPRLEIAFNPATPSVTISCFADAGTLITLEISKDGARTWSAVPGYENRSVELYPLKYESKNPQGAAFFRARGYR